MYFTYILKSVKTGRFYIGYTKDIDTRLEKHNAGHSRATKSGVPWELVWQYSFDSKTEAIKLEYALKRLKSRDVVQSIVDDNYDLSKLGLPGSSVG